MIFDEYFVENLLKIVINTNILVIGFLKLFPTTSNNFPIFNLHKLQIICDQF